MPLNISRTIHRLDENSGRTPDCVTPQLRPPGLENVFTADPPEFGQFICIEDDIRKDDHTGLMMHRIFGADIWFRLHDGSLAKYHQYEDGPAARYLSSFFLQANKIPKFVKARAKDFGIRDDGRMPVFYFPNCTILMAVEVEDLDVALERRHPSHSETPSQSLVGDVYALPSPSNHKALIHFHDISKELATHLEIVNGLTGLNLAMGGVEDETDTLAKAPKFPNLAKQEERSKYAAHGSESARKIPAVLEAPLGHSAEDALADNDPPLKITYGHDRGKRLPGENVKQLSLLWRILITVACIGIGFIFPLVWGLAAFTGWSVFDDIKNAEQNRAHETEIEVIKNAPVSVDDIRWRCDSPAETAFLDAIVDVYDLQTGPGALVGKGMRLRGQVGLGMFRIHGSNASHQYRADFLIDEQLLVEIDGATYHSSPEAVARDKKRDEDLASDGYSTLRIPAQIVFDNPNLALRQVEIARARIRR